MTTIRATAPVRVCDAGGWTDTWFARDGVVCSLAVGPGAEVVVELDNFAGSATLELRATGERYKVDYGKPGPGRHPLVEAVVSKHAPPANRAARVRVASGVPPGSGTGTSASVVVALLAALRAAHGDELDPDALAQEAHSIETGLSLQSGVQDQYAVAHGGCNRIYVDPYPRADVVPIKLGDDVVQALDARLVTVYLGEPHNSSRVHEEVIAAVERDEGGAAKLQALRDAAEAAAASLRIGDLDSYGTALAENTRAQARLHPSLVNADARALIEVALRHGARGWKVNGAGGDGGSFTIVASDDTNERRSMIAEIDQARKWSRLPLQFARHGARVSID